MEPTIFYLLMLQRYISSKKKTLKKISLVFRNISGNFSANIMKKTSLNGYVYGFSVDYRAFDTSNIINIPKYSIKKYGIK